jgi:argininosuccinate lyase
LEKKTEKEKFMGKLWEKEAEINEEVIRFTVGKDYLLDERLVIYDCLSSIAHAEMLAEIGVLKDAEKEEIVKVLNEIIDLSKKDLFKITFEDEDCHTKIENYLTKKLGDVGRKIHTARSRNDQVLTALRLYYKDELKRIENFVKTLMESLKKISKKFGKTKIPGFTHTRKAMVSSVKLWADSFVEALNDDVKFLKNVSNLIDMSPLGTAAGYGVPVLKIDRKLTQRTLGFKRLQKNPIYVQNSRGKFEAEITSALSMILYDVNKLSSDIVFFGEDDLKIIEIPDEFTTGSSIMPHKKNPDVFEMARSNYSKIISLEMRLKTLPMNLISGYHRDLQATKEAIFEAFDTTEETLKIVAKVVERIKVNSTHAKKSITKELLATEKVYKLVEKGIPFRKAYKIVAKEFY